MVETSSRHPDKAQPKTFLLLRALRGMEYSRPRLWRRRARSKSAVALPVDPSITPLEEIVPEACS